MRITAMRRSSACVMRPRGFDTAHARHPDVDENELRAEDRDLQDAVLAGGGLAEEVEARCGLDHLARQAQEGRVIVDGEHAHDGMARLSVPWV
jgi:hypothetical protein